MMTLVLVSLSVTMIQIPNRREKGLIVAHSSKVQPIMEKSQGQEHEKPCHITTIVGNSDEYMLAAHLAPFHSPGFCVQRVMPLVVDGSSHHS